MWFVGATVAPYRRTRVDSYGFVFQEPSTERIAAFLRQIGIPVERATLPETTFLPGLTIEGAGLLVDESQLKFPGDLLHEAGHLAVMTAEQRHGQRERFEPELGDEMAAIGWSFAALMHLGLDPGIVFHAAGYRGASDWFLDEFRAGRYTGVPVLQWMGLTFDAQRAADRGVAPYPHMIRWLRE